MTSPSTQKTVVLICKSIRFHGPLDENFFFDWLDNIQSIATYEGIGRELHIHLHEQTIPDSDLQELIALFYRYHIPNIQQLKKLETAENRHWFKENKDAYWHTPIFGKKRTAYE